MIKIEGARAAWFLVCVEFSNQVFEPRFLVLMITEQTRLAKIEMLGLLEL